MVSTSSALPARSWLTKLFSQPELDAMDRRYLLLGQRQGGADPGPTVCACFGVGANTIRDAIKSGCRSIEGVGSKLKAGTNCGSCRPEIARLIATQAAEQEKVA
jgi:assimilatory nitrate reductase catalytic subunit